MRAFVFNKYKGNLHGTTIPKPAPGERDALVRVKAVSATSSCSPMPAGTSCGRPPGWSTTALASLSGGGLRGEAVLNISG